VGYVDDLVASELKDANTRLASALDSDVVLYYGPMFLDTPTFFARALKRAKKKRRSLSILLTTGGGLVEPVERTVEIIRSRYQSVNFVVPDYAMSAGTIFCMSGDDIYMNHASSLGPIDPQIRRGDGTLVPAMGYLEQLDKLIAKSKEKTISPVEIDMLRGIDLGDVSRYEQARNLTVTLLKKWLATYKFKDWKTHQNGNKVTEAEKNERAAEIAKKLGDISTWHSHGRHIGIKALTDVLRLRIKDYTDDKKISQPISSYYELAMDYIRKNGYPIYMHSGEFVLHGVGR